MDASSAGCQWQHETTSSAGRKIRLKSAVQMCGNDGPEGPPLQSILIHEVKSGPNRLAHEEMGVFGVRLARLAAHVDHNRKFAGWLKSVDESRAEKLDRCGTWLLFREYFKMDGRPKRLAGGIFCQMPLLCGFCAAGRATRHVLALAERIEAVWRLQPALVPYMVTLTARSQQDLRAMQSHVWGAWSTLMQRRRDMLKGKSDSIAGSWVGGFVAGEAKRGKGGYGWHYHLHGIVLGPAGRYVPMWERLKREWSGLLGQSSASVQFQPVKTGRNHSLMSAILECAKYAVKWDSQSPQDRWDAFQALTRVRSLRTFGALYGVPLTQDVTDDLDEFAGQEFRELVYKFFAGSYQPRETLEAQRETAFDEWDDGGYR